MLGPNPLKALGLGRLAGGAGAGPKVPTMPPFFSAGEEEHPRSGKKNKVDRHNMRNSLPLMLLNFQRKFYNFFVIALDAIGSFGWILRYGSRYKRPG